MACKVYDVTPQTNVPAKVGAGKWQPMTQMPPKLPLRFSGRKTHSTHAGFVSWSHSTIAQRPDAFLIRGSLLDHTVTSRPPAKRALRADPPHKGEGTFTAACGCRRTSAFWPNACRHRTTPSRMWPA